MKKRIVISTIIIAALILILGITQGPGQLPALAPILPPIIAIALAFITHEVLISLFVGIFVGAVMTFPINTPINFLYAASKGLYKVADTYIVNSLADSSHISVVIFTIFIGGIVGLVGQSGGLQGIVIKLSKMAKNSVFAQFYTWLLGILIFFDDYANSLIIGNTMRPLTDRYRISREKLSFIVDATSAPITSLVIVSTWIGYEIGLIDDIFKTTNSSLEPYMAFIESIPFRFYVILMLLFIPLMIFLRRDFSVMLKAEERARETGECLKEGSEPISGTELSQMSIDSTQRPKARNAIIPISILVFGVLIGIYITGYNSILDKSGAQAATMATLRDILGKSDSFKSLIWASFTSSLVAMIMIYFQKIMTFSDIIKAWMKGAKSMFTAVVVLTLAWSLGAVLKDIKTADCVTNLLKDVISVEFLPVLIFLVSAITSFSTGTSWGTMAIIFPIAIPLSIQLGAPLPIADANVVIYASIGSILSGAVFGDHCSPISDTTILSSIASQIDHMDHVSSQMPYALTVGFISCIVGYLPIGFGLNPYIGMLLGIGLMVAALLIFGKKVKNVGNADLQI